MHWDIGSVCLNGYGTAESGAVAGETDKGLEEIFFPSGMLFAEDHRWRKEVVVVVRGGVMGSPGDLVAFGPRSGLF